MSERKLSVKVSEKGAVSLYGLRRFPITFYREEWAVIGKVMPGIAKFIEQHLKELSEKGDASTAPKEGHTSL